MDTYVILQSAGFKMQCSRFTCKSSDWVTTFILFISLINDTAHILPPNFFYLVNKKNAPLFPFFQKVPGIRIIVSLDYIQSVEPNLTYVRNLKSGVLTRYAAANYVGVKISSSLPSAPILTHPLLILGRLFAPPKLCTISLNLVNNVYDTWYRYVIDIS